MWRSAEARLGQSILEALAQGDRLCSQAIAVSLAGYVATLTAAVKSYKRKLGCFAISGGCEKT
jgi:hypothetical protein